MPKVNPKAVKCGPCGKMIVPRPSGELRKHRCVEVPADTCEGCGQRVPLRLDGVMSTHLRVVALPSGAVKYTNDLCDGSPAYEDPAACSHPGGFTWSDDGKGHSGSFCASCGAPEPVSDPAPTVRRMDDDTPRKGPWFISEYPGECSSCYVLFEEGKTIRADGEGGWECEHPEEEEPETTPQPEAPQVAAEEELSEADAFLLGGATPNQKPVTDSTGRRDARGRYLVKDPETGDFQRYKNGNVKGFTRVTTFVKAASDSVSLSDWRARNVLMGAAKKPSVAAKAWGLTHEDDREALNELVEELSKVAGAKDAADRGTDIHHWAEVVDAHHSPDEALEDVPPHYRATIELYLSALKEAGFHPLPHLMERTTMVKDFGGIVGTFDRVYYHSPSDSYVIGDLKSGKTLDYGIDEMRAQLALYAYGVNRHGVYDWAEERWAPALEDPSERDEPRPVKIRTDVGVIVHLPQEGKEAGTVRLARADLVRGWEYAEECARVRSMRSSKGKAPTWSNDGLPELVQEPTARSGAPEREKAKREEQMARMEWDARFLTVTSNAEATAVWRSAKAAGIAGPELNRLVSLARLSLRMELQSGKG